MKLGTSQQQVLNYLKKNGPSTTTTIGNAVYHNPVEYRDGNRDSHRKRPWAARILKRLVALNLVEETENYEFRIKES